MIDPTMVERITCALETIADAVSTSKARYCRIVAKEGFAPTRGGETVGLLWRITFFDNAEAHTFKVDFFLQHPSCRDETRRGRLLFDALAKALDVPDCNFAALVGKPVVVVFKGSRVIDFWRDDIGLAAEARKVPPPDEIDFEAASLDYIQSRLEAEGIDPQRLA